MAQKTRDENQTLSGNAEPFFKSGKNEAWNAHQKCVFLIWGPDNTCTTEQCGDCAVFQLAREKMAQATQTGDLGNGL